MKVKHLPAAVALLTLVACSASSFAAVPCRQGYVWREATPTDYVCVTGAERDAANIQNRNAQANRSPNGGAYGPDTCKQGFVWREAGSRWNRSGTAHTYTSNDHVCVTPHEREVAKKQTEDHCLHAEICKKTKK